MAYRRDKDLEFLKDVKPEDLAVLKEIITQEKNQNLSDKDPSDPFYWSYVAEQIQLYGGDTLANILRLGDGVLYREVLCDVCDKLDIQYNKHLDTIDAIENNLIKSLYADAWEKMSDSEKCMIFFLGGIPYQTMIGGNAGLITIKNILSSISIKSISLYDLVIGNILTKIIKKPESIIAIGGYFAFLIGPLGLGLFGLNLSGPAYRITIPACLSVARLRIKMKLTPEEIRKGEILQERLERMKEIIDKIIKDEEYAKYMYIFWHKILEYKDVVEIYDNVIKSLAFGETNIYERNKTNIEAMIKNETFSSILKKIIDSGLIKKEDIYSNMIFMISQIEGINDEPEKVIMQSSDPAIQNLIIEFEAVFSKS